MPDLRTRFSQEPDIRDLSESFAIFWKHWKTLKMNMLNNYNGCKTPHLRPKKDAICEKTVGDAISYWESESKAKLKEKEGIQNAGL